MKKIYFLGVVAIFLSLGVSYAEKAPLRPVNENIPETIAYLLDAVAKSHFAFIRNGDSYTGAEAARHMKDKYKYFKDKIKTPEDFIRLAATKSLMTGKPYLVKISGDTEVHADQWLQKMLEQYRKSIILQNQWAYRKTE